MKLTKKQKSEIGVASCFAIPALYALYEMHTKFVELEMHTGGGETNAALFPRMLSWLILLLVVIQITSIILQAKKSDAPQDEKLVFLERVSLKNVLLVFITFILYIFGLSTLGFYVTTPLIMVAFFAILGVKKVWQLLLLGFGCSTAIWYIFGVLLRVVLPVGQFGLYL